MEPSDCNAFSSKTHYRAAMQPATLLIAAELLPVLRARMITKGSTLNFYLRYLLKKSRGTPGSGMSRHQANEWSGNIAVH